MPSEPERGIGCGLKPWVFEMKRAYQPRNAVLFSSARCRRERTCEEPRGYSGMRSFVSIRSPGSADMMSKNSDRRSSSGSRGKRVSLLA